MKLVARTAVSTDLTGAGGSASKALNGCRLICCCWLHRGLFVCVESVPHSVSISTGLLDMAACSPQSE